MLAVNDIKNGSSEANSLLSFLRRQTTAMALIRFCICCYLLLLPVLSNETSGSISFDPNSYYFLLSYEEVQTNVTIFTATFNVPPANASIVHVEIPTNRYFKFRISDYGVQNIRPLPAGQHSFQIVAFSDFGDFQTIIQASVVVDVISQSGRACIEQSFGSCHHFCRENDIQYTGYECYCERGYILQGNFDCLAGGGNPELFISNASKIARVTKFGPSYSSLLELKNITTFDYNFETSILYVVTSKEYYDSIIEFHLQNLTVKILKQFYNAYITSVAVNWQSNEIYYLDELASAISSFNVMSLVDTLVLTNLDSPRNLVYSNLRKVMWISGSQHNTSIKCYSLNEKITTILFTLSNIVDIAVSSLNDQLFVLTDVALFSVALKSNDSVQHITSFVAVIPVALDVFEVYSYVLFEGGFLLQLNNQRPSENYTVPALPGSMDIVVYHALKQVHPIGNVDCSQCEGECVVFGDSISRCVCSEEFILGVDGYSCLRSEASTFLASFSFHGGTIVELDLFGPWRQNLLIGQSANEGKTAGLITGMDVNLKDGVAYYGDSELGSIWQVSLKPQHSNIDDRKRVLDNNSASDMAYDWINRQLYWIDEGSKSIYQADVNTFLPKVFFEAEHQLNEIVVNPFDGFLYWSEYTTGIKKKMAGEISSPIETVWDACCIQALTIDILSDSLYWFQNIANNISLIELSLATNTNRTLLSLPMSEFNPFRSTILQNYLIVTLFGKTEFGIINIDDSNIAFKETRHSTPYLAVAVTSSIRQPSQASFTCLTSGRNCSYMCVEDEDSDQSNCICPVGYMLNKDLLSCYGCPPDTFGPDCSPCTITCVHGICSRLDGSCICDPGYTGSTCSAPICDQVSCGNGGECAGPNFCQCKDTYTGLECTGRRCTESYCTFQGTCSVLDDGFNLDCNCDPGRAGSQCQIPDFPFALEGYQIGVPVGVIVPIVLAIALIGSIVFGYIKIKRNRKSAEIGSSGSKCNEVVIAMNSVEGDSSRTDALDDISPVV